MKPLKKIKDDLDRGNRIIEDLSPLSYRLALFVPNDIAQVFLANLPSRGTNEMLSSGWWASFGEAISALTHTDIVMLNDTLIKLITVEREIKTTVRDFEESYVRWYTGVSKFICIVEAAKADHTYLISIPTKCSLN